MSHSRTSSAPARTHKPGSKSPKHRGHRPEDAVGARGKKPRWSAEQRVAKGRAPERPRGERGERLDSGSRADRRPEWTPPNERPAARRRAGEQPRRFEERVERDRGRRSDSDGRFDRLSDRGRTSPGRFDEGRDRGQRSDSDGRFDRLSDRGRTSPGRFVEGRDRGQRSGSDGRFDKLSDRRRTERPAREDRPARRESAQYPAREQRFAPHDDVVLERLEAQAITADEVDGVSFADLGLGGNITRALAELGATNPFPIQAATIPVTLSGRDVLGRGRTGSGKTIAFGAPLVERLMENGGGRSRKPGRAPRALILAPTRELALQIDRTVQPIARSVGLFTTQVYGGVPYHRQVGALQRGVDIVIGTPGRIEDLVNSGRLDLSSVTITVLDEADHMCDLGFLEPVQRILDQTAPGGQRLLFSATLDSGVATLVEQYLVDPAVHEVAGEDQASSTIDHRVLLIEQRDKREIVAQLAAGGGKTLVFTRTRAFAEDLSDYLDEAGIPSVSLHGDLNQSRRTRNLEKLTSGRVRVLVATDVAARGIHVDDISLVVQADAPDEYKTYLHRAGRTGRAGKAGTVVTLAPRNRRRRVDELLQRAEIEATVSQVSVGDDLLGELAAL